MFKAVVLVFLLAFLPACAADSQDMVLNILYTGAIRGELEPCGCSPKTESGGLARLSGYISANQEGLKPYVLVDAGNSMDEDTPQGRLKADALLRSFNIMGYDAVALSSRDLFAEGFVATLIEDYGIPLITDGSESSISFERAHFRVNISADPKGYRKGMLNILLTDRSVSEATAFKGWDVIVTSSGETIEEPLREGKTVIVSGYPKGEKLGILSLQLDKDGKVSGVTHRWQELKKDVAEDTDVRGVLNEYDAKVAELLKEEEGKVRSNGSYIGASICARCHQPFMEGWQSSRHAKAFNSLEEVGKSMDPECIKCHSTGHGEEGGFYSAVSTPELANVQCEVCHGPGREHLADYDMPMKPVGKSTCLGCHTEEQSPEFDFGHYLEKIKH
ncbi:MAG: hypothetical protein KAR06_11615 [Deltaproteobacteria bacterium]|nr:hypothetical protein [Deltaproteobacteria bacterium]